MSDVVRLWIGIVVLAGGIISGLYFGIWVFFIGGVAQIIAAFQHNPIIGIDVGIGAVKILFAGTVAGLCFFVGGIIAKNIIK